MPTHRPTYKDIAQAAGVSVFSVSCALRNRPGVSEATQKQIKEIAADMGYRPNPMVTALMTNHRRLNNRRKMRAIIACLQDRETRDNRSKVSTNRESNRGYRTALDEAGFLYEEFIIEDYAENSSRLVKALKNRTIPGIIIHAGTLPKWCCEGLQSFAIASIGSRQINLPCHFAVTDHYQNCWRTLLELSQLGYKRIGFAMSRKHWFNSIDYRSLAAFTAWNIQMGKSRPLVHWTEEWDKKAFITWIQRTKPDVLIAAEHEPLNFLKESGYHIPDDIGFAHLGLDPEWRDLAGIQQNSFQVGEAAIQLIVDQINRNAYGSPDHPRSTQVAGDWIPGPSVRQH
ncbi:MAG: LacI family DNA-binding transcriptional regulator [Verrucomicrobiota bacterium JB024]|nr:LacI family DNA-binding transcriptional regulator [Verrucomicrobiota bacterium JB024]